MTKLKLKYLKEATDRIRLSSVLKEFHVRLCGISSS